MLELVQHTHCDILTCKDPYTISTTVEELFDEIYKNNGYLNNSFPTYVADDTIRNFEVVGVDEISDLCNVNYFGHSDSIRNSLKPMMVLKKHLTQEFNIRSTCPWRYTINTNLSRVPEHIAEATCLCDKCAPDFVKPNRTRRKTHRKRHNRVLETGSCQAIMSPTIVFRKECNIETGTFELTLSTENIAVGCHCLHNFKNILK